MRSLLCKASPGVHWQAWAKQNGIFRTIFLMPWILGPGNKSSSIHTMTRIFVFSYMYIDTIWSPVLSWPIRWRIASTLPCPGQQGTALLRLRFAFVVDLWISKKRLGSLSEREVTTPWHPLCNVKARSGLCASGGYASPKEQIPTSRTQRKYVVSALLWVLIQAKVLLPNFNAFTHFSLLKYCYFSLSNICTRLTF